MSLLVKEASRFGERKALELLRVLLEYNYDANYIDDDGNTPLHLVCYNDNPEFVSALILTTNQTNSPNHDDKTPMQIALESKNKCAIKLLFEEGIDFSPNDYLHEWWRYAECLVTKILCGHPPSFFSLCLSKRLRQRRHEVTPT